MIRILRTILKIDSQLGKNASQTAMRTRLIRALRYAALTGSNYNNIICQVRIRPFIMPPPFTNKTYTHYFGLVNIIKFSRGVALFFFNLVYKKMVRGGGFPGLGLTGNSY